MSEFLHLDKKDTNLVCFLSYGRKDLTEKGFLSLLESKRENDRILVIDQEGINLDFYRQFMDRIEYLIVLKYNCFLGPAWVLMKYIAMWLKIAAPICSRHESGWRPEYITVVENDTVGEKGWIDEVIKIAQTDKYGIVTAYNAPEHEAKDILKEENGMLIKESTPGVHMTFKTDYFITLFDTLGIKGQDWEISEYNAKRGKLVACIDKIQHTGEGRNKQK